MRPGRLDRILYVGPPNLEGRIEILRIRTHKMSVEENLDLEQIAKLLCYCASALYGSSSFTASPMQTEGCSGADMSALCQEAALLTMKADINAPFVSTSPL